ncbi:acyl-CoA dehydrogenase family protein [Acrocarpospora macrocephala]|uniref:Acyl-CoA dehydrogenase n=1 Tax=Acrocarpospora macrocephala TaxID=150177 RepID=A0A5M3WBY2_9ACTN|nr:acyl-CoA dehydrogenase [Acrocarpospora macrocephala]GES06565.1 acyl-CoA dehydrogenase [Acrocarpospora macrocephala]
MHTTEIPQRAEMLRRATDLVPLIRDRAPGAEHLRRMDDDVINALIETGILKMRVPVRYGGFESDTRSLVDVGIQLGRGDGAVGFTVALWWITSWIVGLFPDPVQDEVWGSDPDVLVCGTLAPTGMAAAVDGGILVNGRWAFNSGAAHSQWKMLSAVLTTPDGGGEPVMALVPIKDIQVVDDWHVAGLRATGSVSMVADNLFIPQDRVIAIAPLMMQQYASKLNADRPIYRCPMIPAASASTIGKVAGLMMNAREAFFERLPGRGITYSGYGDQREAPRTHHQVAEAAMKIDEAEFHAYRLADLVDAKCANGETWSVTERALARVAMGRVCQLAHDAIGIYNTASGGSSIFESVPIQRIVRDMEAINLHALNHPNTNMELYGRVLCGLEPDSPYL